MPEERPYEPMPVLGPDGRPIPRADLPMPDLHFARPMGAWVIVAALFIVVVGLWAAVATYFSIHA
ncbi:conserved hypothetical protein [Thiomonas sp. X19]|uniref:hypothetical protein n=1 Tax=Thiomonas sp. X19 TaxID=1050370 RepID=UPI000B62C688|nr:hypothetical protein [Thiomonas sp. X19]SCC94174.1 conserved hypothetical protein [Thiomonas sp. X19]